MARSNCWNRWKRHEWSQIMWLTALYEFLQRPMSVCPGCSQMKMLTVNGTCPLKVSTNWFYSSKDHTTYSEQQNRSCVPTHLSCTSTFTQKWVSNSFNSLLHSRLNICFALPLQACGWHSWRTSQKINIRDGGSANWSLIFNQRTCRQLRTWWMWIIDPTLAFGLWLELVLHHSI